MIFGPVPFLMAGTTQARQVAIAEYTDGAFWLEAHHIFARQDGLMDFPAEAAAILALITTFHADLVAPEFDVV